MSRSQDRYIRARRVLGRDETHLRLANISARPIRLAYIIKDDTSEEQLLKIVKYNSTIWGGIYSLLVPSDGRTIREDWFRCLLNHDPDYILVCGEFDGVLLKSIFDETQPYYIVQWDDDILNQHLNDNETIGGVSIRHIINHYYATFRPDRDSIIRIPQITDSNPFYFHATAQFGILPEEDIEHCVNQLKAQKVFLQTADLNEYVNEVIELRAKLTPLHMTRWRLGVPRLGVWFSGTSLGCTVVLSGMKPIYDFCLFWNLRMQPSPIRDAVMFIPQTAIQKEADIKAITDYCKLMSGGANYIVLASSSTKTDRMKRIRQRMSQYTRGSSIEYIDIWYSNFVTNPFRAHLVASRDELSIKGSYFRLKSTRPDMQSSLSRSNWVVDVQLETEGRNPTAFIPPTFSRLNYMLSGQPQEIFIRTNRGYRVRMASGYISHRVSSRDDFVGGFLPPQSEVLTELVKSSGYKPTITDKSKYTQGVTSIFGDIDEAVIFQNPSFRRLLENMSDGTAYTPEEMLKIFRPGSASKAQVEIYDLVTDLTIKGFFLRGTKIQCPVCDLLRWYPLDSIREIMQCAGCLTQIQPPIEAKFYYQLNELVIRGVKQGCIPVMLTLLFLRGLAQESFMFIPGIRVKKGAYDRDIDILAACDGHLILCECKALVQSKEGKLSEEIYDQLNDVVLAAREMKASIVFLSTLLPDVNDDVRARVAAINGQLGGLMRVHLLTMVDLERGHKNRPHEYNSDLEMVAGLDDFLPHYLGRGASGGWIKEPGSRTISF